MKTLLILSAILTITYADKRCHGVYVNDRYYNLDIIKEGINHLHDLVINRRDDTLYFVFEDFSDLNGLARLLGYIDMNTHNAYVIDGIKNASTIAIDQSTGKVFVGAVDGLYKINERKIPEKLPINDDIRHLHFKDGLYFSNKKKEVFKFEDGRATPMNELRGIEVESFIIDNDNNVFFTNNKNLFRIKLGTRAVNTHEEHKVDALATDVYSKPYICTNKGLYTYNKYKFVFDKESDLRNLKAITFNRANEAIYSVYDLIVKLSLSEIGCFED